MSQPDPDAARTKFAAARADLAAALIERDQEVDLVLRALIAREHVLLVGPPGCAKGLLLDAVMRWLGGTTFTCLLTRFTATEELFGPVSVAGLKDDEFRRITTGKLPEADGCFLDEVFSATRSSETAA
jgi:MoxR-like ATPase